MPEFKGPITYNAQPVLVRNPATESWKKDDFGTGGPASANVGELGWARAGGSTIMVAAESGHVGIVQIQTGTTTATVAAIATRSSPTLGDCVASELFDNLWLIRLNTNDVNTTVRFGVGVDWTASQPTSGAYVEKLDADTNWFYVSRAAGTQTRTDSGVAVGTGWIAFNPRRKDSATIGYRIATTLGGIATATETTITTNLPTLGVLLGGHIINSAAASKTVDLDYADLRITGIAR